METLERKKQRLKGNTMSLAKLKTLQIVCGKMLKKKCALPWAEMRKTTSQAFQQRANERKGFCAESEREGCAAGVSKEEDSASKSDFCVLFQGFEEDMFSLLEADLEKEEQVGKRILPKPAFLSDSQRRN